MSFFSTTITVTTAVQSLMANKPYLRKVVQATILVRSMGTATYVAIGGKDSQDRQLKTVGDGISIGVDALRPRERPWLNLAEIYVVSDTSDAVLEVFGEAVS